MNLHKLFFPKQHRQLQQLIKQHSELVSICTDQISHIHELEVKVETLDYQKEDIELEAERLQETVRDLELKVNILESKKTDLEFELEEQEEINEVLTFRIDELEDELRG